MMKHFIYIVFSLMMIGGLFAGCSNDETDTP